MTEAELKALIGSWGWTFNRTENGWVLQSPTFIPRQGRSERAWQFTNLDDITDFIRGISVKDPDGNLLYYNPEARKYQATPSEPQLIPERAPRKLPSAPNQYEKRPPEPAQWKTFAPQILWKDIWRVDIDSGRVSIVPEYQKVFDRFQETYGPLAAPTPQEQLAQTRETRLAKETREREARLTAAERARQERQARLDKQSQNVLAAQERRLGLQQQLDIARSPGDYLAYFNRLQNQNPTSFTTPTGIPRTFEAGFGGLGGQQTGLPAARGELPAPVQPAVTGDLRDFVALNPGAQPPGFQAPKAAQQRYEEAQAEWNALLQEDAPDPNAIARLQTTMPGLLAAAKAELTATGEPIRLATIAARQGAQGGTTGIPVQGVQGGQFQLTQQGTPDVEAEVQRRLAQHRKILADNGLPFPNEQLQGLMQFFRQQVQGERGIQGGTTGVSTQLNFQGDGGQGGGLARTLGRESPFPLFRDLYGTRGVSGIPTRQSLQGVTGIPELSRGAFSRLPPSEQELYVGGFELAGVPRQDVFASLNRRPEAPFFRRFR